MKLKLILLAFTLIPSLCYSANGTYTGTITEILGGPGHGYTIYLSVGGSVTESCTTDTRYSFQIDTSNPSSSIWVSMLLAAYAAEKIVYLQGTGVCTNNVENLNQVRLM